MAVNSRPLYQLSYAGASGVAGTTTVADPDRVARRPKDSRGPLSEAAAILPL